MLRKLRLGAYFGVIWKVRAELLTCLTALAGWTLLTWGIQEVIGSAWVWRVSLGLLLLGLVGFKFLWHILTRGLYLLTRPEKKTDGTPP